MNWKGCGGKQSWPNLTEQIEGGKKIRIFDEPTEIRIEKLLYTSPNATV